MKGMPRFAAAAGEMMDHSLEIAGRRIPLPRSRPVRIALGTALVIGGIFGFLPILGFWMVPLGVLVLARDVAWVERFRSKVVARWTVWREQRAARQRRRGGDLA
jgi:hypothetical protein